MLAALRVVDVEAATATAGAGAEPALRLREAEAEAGGELGIILLCLQRVECKKKMARDVPAFLFFQTNRNRSKTCKKRESRAVRRKGVVCTEGSGRVDVKPWLLALLPHLLVVLCLEMCPSFSNRPPACDLFRRLGCEG